MMRKKADVFEDTRSYIEPVKLGAVMRGSTASRVLASRSKKAAVGDFVCSHVAGWTEYAILRDAHFEPASSFPGLDANAPQDMLSVLGMTGATAWWGMTQVADLKPGELFVVSGAAGATGSVAGQIAKIKGATVVGICGSDDKCKWLVDELGFDVALNYKAADFKDKFKAATKNYIDVYFDNGTSAPDSVSPRFGQRCFACSYTDQVHGKQSVVKSWTCA